MPAAFEDNNLVVPLLNKIGSWLHLSKHLVRLRLISRKKAVWRTRLTSHDNTLIITLIAINKGGGTTKRNVSFDHCEILLSILYENTDHVYHLIHTTTVNRTEGNRV